jgi:hypothetical protein
MKSVWIILIAMGSLISTVEAQNWNEWFSQKNTQKKYLIQQIVALQVYLKYLKEGYDIAKKGLKKIEHIKDANSHDHQKYFESLRLVNPSVRNSSKVSVIIAYQTQIINQFRKLDNECEKEPNLSKEEIRYIKDVHENLLKQCEVAIDDLNTILIDRASQMEDDDRIERIDGVYEDMKNKYAFTRSFCNSTRMLIVQRTNERLEIETSRSLTPEL